MPPLEGQSLGRALRILEAMEIPATACRIHYREAPGEVHTVLGQHPPPGGPAPDEVALEVCGRNPIRLLPGVFRRMDDEAGGFLRRLLWPFAQILLEIDRQIAEFPRALDPATAPHRHLPWLSYLLSVATHEEGEPERLREIIARTPTFHRWRGTPRGLVDSIERLAGVSVSIREGDLRGGTGRVGVHSVLGANRLDGGPLYEIDVPLTREEAGDPLVRKIHRIAAAEGPAHARHALCFLEEPRRRDPPACVGVGALLGGEARIFHSRGKTGGCPRLQ